MQITLFHWLSKFETQFSFIVVLDDETKHFQVEPCPCPFAPPRRRGGWGDIWWHWNWWPSSNTCRHRNGGTQVPLALQQVGPCMPSGTEGGKYCTRKCTVFCQVDEHKNIIGSLSRDVFERRTSTRSGLFALLSRDFEQIFGQIGSIRIKTLGNTNTVASRLIKREKGSLPVDVRCSKTSLLKLPNKYKKLYQQIQLWDLMESGN